jgi:hypothetical protein
LKQKKIFILLPDGVGLRNFAFSSFVGIGEELGWEVIFWNNTLFDLSKLGYQEIKLQIKPRPYTDLLKRSKIESELNIFTKKFNDDVYQTYKFPSSGIGLKAHFKNLFVHYTTKKKSSQNGVNSLREKIKSSERKSEYYRDCKAILEKEKPDVIFCTNQRPINAVAAITAAKDLEIPTCCFIYSWDNLPKATLIVEADYYFVWSEHMKDELLNYYPHIKSQNIYTTGTPQFESHYNPELLTNRSEFFKEFNLDTRKQYLCYSGDDITTCPDDPKYLNDVANAIRSLNCKGYDLGLIFRRCPVDFSDRYDHILQKNKDIITAVNPRWQKMGENWNAILPTTEDLKLQMNTIYHTEAVINLGSSMVFDYAAFKKPCLFINYDKEIKEDNKWSVSKIYNFIHFRSIPSENSVIWINSEAEISNKIIHALNNSSDVVKLAKTWFAKINQHPPEKSSNRIWSILEEIISKSR